MDQKKFAEFFVLVLLLMLVLGIVGWKFVQLNPGYDTYINSANGYSLQIPASWQEKYKVIEQADGNIVSFMYMPGKGQAAKIFSISKVSSDAWLMISNNQQVKPVTRLLNVQGSDVYYADWLANNPYQGQEARIYLTLVRDISNILNSFSVQVNDFGQIGETEQCAQVVTLAKNTFSGELKEFPTPCDVPDNWEPVRP